jgi:hypothetical protein
MARFAQFQGAIGPVFAGNGLRFAPTQNPNVNMVAGFTGGPLPGQPRSFIPGRVMAPRTASATMAGRPSIGCCGDCAARYRGF